MFLCSAGDFYSGGDIFNEAKGHIVARILGYLEYDAITIGELDLSYGLDKLVRDEKAYNLNLVCANLFRKGRGKARVGSSLRRQKRVFPAYRVVSRGGVRVGFIGIISPKTKLKSAGQHATVEALTYVIEEPTPIVKKLVPKVKRKCDVLVLLAHMESAELDTVLPDLPGVDVVVLGHNSSSRSTKEPLMVGTVPVYMAGFKGQHMGHLKVTLDPQNRIADAKNNIVVLDKNIPDDKDVAELLTRFEEENRRVQKELYARQQLLGKGGSNAGQDIYLGLGTCLQCHKDAFETYIKTGHARAFASLSSRSRHRDSDCIGCHTTGYGETGGFDGVRAIGSPVDLVDVQCEACHGPGAEHSRDGRYAKRAVKSCENCHTGDQDPTFDYSRDWEKIAH